MQAVLARRLLLVFGLALTCLHFQPRPLAAAPGHVASPGSTAPASSFAPASQVGAPPASYYDPFSFWWRHVVGDPSAFPNPYWGVQPVYIMLPDGSVIAINGDEDLFNPIVWNPGSYPNPGYTPPAEGGTYPGGPPVYTDPYPYVGPPPGYTDPAYDWNWNQDFVPSIPQGLRAVWVDGGVHVSWDQNRERDVSSYQLWRSLKSDSGFKMLIQTGINSHLDTSAQAGLEYWYIVAAVDYTGLVSEFSPPVSSGRGSLPSGPAAPSELKAEARPTEVILTWKPSTSAGIVGYYVERSDGAAGSWATIGTGDAPTFTDRSVRPGVRYYYRVRAYDDEGVISDPSNTVEVVIPVPEDDTPSPPADDTPPPPSTGSALNVLDFGASVARDGDDTSAIQKAFDAARDKNRDVYFPAGYYRITQKLVFRAGGRTLFGDGMTRSTLAGNTDRHTLIELLRTSNVTVRDLRFEGSLTNEQNTNVWPAIECASTTGTKLFDNHSYGTGYLVRDSGGTGTFVQGNICEDYGRIGYLIGSGAVVKDNRFICRPSWVFADQMNGIYASAGKANLLIENNEFIHCGSYAMTLWGSNSGVWTENIVVQQNIFQDCDRVMVVASSASGPGYRNVKFLNNTVRRSGDKSIHIGKFNGSNADGSGLVIDGNVFEDPGSDMSIFITNWNASGPISGVRISNNQFLHPGKSSVHGIYVWQNVAPMSDVLIENNTFSDFGHNGSTEKSHSAIYLRSANGIRITGNTFNHWPDGGYSTTACGIKFDITTRNAKIDRNTFNGNGKKGTFGIRVTGSGGSSNGSISDNAFRKSILSNSGVPIDGNTHE